MPGWHKATRKWRESGKLRIIGITQEQHRERCHLFAQWQGLDWPILWDPFNMTGSAVVPTFTLIDEHGIVRALRVDLRTIETSFLSVKFPAPEAMPPDPDVGDFLVEIAGTKQGSSEHGYYHALSDLLWRGEASFDKAMPFLKALREANPDDPVIDFRLGVAYRMRHDPKKRQVGDFQKAIESWTRARASRPNQYIWRRRIQQYGPSTDKPYPFYDWVAKASQEIAARGEEPIALRATLTAAERALPARSLAPPVLAEEPDPEGKIRRGGGKWIEVDSAYAFVTKGRGSTARLHVVFRPQPASTVLWNNEAEPMKIWLGAPARRLVEHASPKGATTREERRFEWEVDLTGAKSVTLQGYALFNACRGADGECTYLRRDFQITIQAPVRPGR